MQVKNALRARHEDFDDDLLLTGTSSCAEYRDEEAVGSLYWRPTTSTGPYVIIPLLEPYPFGIAKARTFQHGPSQGRKDTTTQWSRDKGRTRLTLPVKTISS